MTDFLANPRLMTKSPNLISLSQWRVALLCAAAIALPFSVNAGPMEKNPVVENLQRPFDWTGFYIGGNVGGALSEYEFRGSGGDTDGHLFSDVDVDLQANFLPPGEFPSTPLRFIDRFDKDRPDREELRGSILGGGQIGYQHQFGHFVVGIEGDFDRTSMRSIQTFRDSIPTLFEFTDGAAAFGSTDTNFTGRREAQTNWQGSVRGKFGYATGALLFYGTAGVAFAQVDVWAHDVASTFFDATFDVDDVAPTGPQAPRGLNQTENFNVVNTEIDRDSDVMVGWTAGFGLEVAFNDAVTLALEYRHNGYGDETFHFNDHNSGRVISPGGTNVDFDNDQVTVKMNILLNHFFSHSGGSVAGTTPAANTVAMKSPFGGSDDSMQVGYTKAKDASKWSAKDKEVAVVEEFNWTGFYIGANAGGVWTDYDFHHFDAEVDTTELFFENVGQVLTQADTNAPQGIGFGSFAAFEIHSTDRGSDDSIIGGGQFGYQHQWNHWVFGVEADFSGLSTEKSSEFASSTFQVADVKGFIGAETTLETERKATVDWMASARARIGYARGPVMLYVTGGGAWANVRTWANDRRSVISSSRLSTTGGELTSAAGRSIALMTRKQSADGPPVQVANGRSAKSPAWVSNTGTPHLMTQIRTTIRTTRSFSPREIAWTSIATR